LSPARSAVDALASAARVSGTAPFVYISARPSAACSSMPWPVSALLRERLSTRLRPLP
jgi:hypothetical protein